MECYLKEVIVPFVSCKRKGMGLPETQPGLPIFDCFKGQNTTDINGLLQEYNIMSVIIPHKCTANSSRLIFQSTNLL